MVGGVAGGVTPAPAAGGFRAEPQYVSAKTSVWWDIENCQVPKNCDAHAIAQNISSALARVNYCGPVSICAYGDTNRIPPLVQQALSSTGVTLNHVPAGVKDASDKRILVDMLFWAVDNPAPANYLLISGDRDFSNALHQLRFRRYNILLAKPQKASVPLVAAATAVWLWSSLCTGGAPMPPTVSSQPSGGDNDNQTSSTTGMPQSGRHSGEPVRPKGPVQPVTSTATTAGFGNHSSYGNGSGNAFDPGLNEKHVRSNGNAAANQVGGQGNMQAKQFKKAPHEFFGGGEPGNSYSGNAFTNTSYAPMGDPSSNNMYMNLNQQNSTHQNYPLRPNTLPQQHQPTFASDHMPTTHHNHGYRPIPPRPDFRYPSPSVPPRPDFRYSAPPVPPRPEFRHSAPSVHNVPDIGKLSISQTPNYAPNSSNFRREPPQEYNAGSFQSLHVPSFSAPPPNHVMQEHGGQAKYWRPRGPSPPQNLCTLSTSTSVSSNDATQETQPQLASSDHVNGLMTVILRALDILKHEKVTPSKANISYCIRFGENQEHQNVDVEVALDYAIKYKKVVKQTTGSFQVFIPKNGTLWMCVNPKCPDPEKYPAGTWDKIKKFITSENGRSALLASECRYEAAMILKRACLEDLVLGEVLCIIEMMIDMKKWIGPHESGWQPVSIISCEEFKIRDKKCQGGATI
ncbi:unnamed protein product [Linum trigynum]|uniref:NYN domain-containing protein n=1 Tax=Linum trigynum TaxID=586398 RepID=A0AAV2FL98_9ROSI